MAEATVVHVKAEHNGDIRRFGTKTDVGYDALRRSINEIFWHGARSGEDGEKQAASASSSAAKPAATDSAFDVYYLDDEGDQVKVTCDVELQEAWSFVNENALLRLKVVSKEVGRKKETAHPPTVDTMPSLLRLRDSFCVPYSLSNPFSASFAPADPKTPSDASARGPPVKGAKKEPTTTTPAASEDPPADAGVEVEFENEGGGGYGPGGAFMPPYGGWGGGLAGGFRGRGRRSQRGHGHHGARRGGHGRSGCGGDGWNAWRGAPMGWGGAWGFPPPPPPPPPGAGVGAGGAGGGFGGSAGFGGWPAPPSEQPFQFSFGGESPAQAAKRLRSMWRMVDKDLRKQLKETMQQIGVAGELNTLSSAVGDLWPAFQDFGRSIPESLELPSTALQELLERVRATLAEALTEASLESLLSLIRISAEQQSVRRLLRVASESVEAATSFVNTPSTARDVFSQRPWERIPGYGTASAPPAPLFKGDMGPRVIHLHFVLTRTGYIPDGESLRGRNILLYGDHTMDAISRFQKDTQIDQEVAAPGVYDEITRQVLLNLLQASDEATDATAATTEDAQKPSSGETEPAGVQDSNAVPGCSESAAAGPSNP